MWGAAPAVRAQACLQFSTTAAAPCKEEASVNVSLGESGWSVQAQEPLAAQHLNFGISGLALVLWDEKALERTAVMTQPLAPGCTIYLETSPQQLVFHALAITVPWGLKSLLQPVWVLLQLIFIVTMELGVSCMVWHLENKEHQGWHSTAHAYGKGLLEKDLGKTLGTSGHPVKQSDMARGQQKIQSQQKNAKKQAEQKKKQGHDQKAAAKAALIYTCTVCRTQMPDPKTFKQHFESKHPKTPLPPELADVQA
ncbi:hypothetical protein DV515_00000447 [Chloebia gouldiae]|uniref:Zinc finger protein 706 n=1 Tax=Chloebia gouldiae TaxID=44316 RepID=A0A3L8T0M0_CHLGU|nr:hypothetical protein DV515_00000447 [Chloebia gouldiae]